MFIHMDSSCNDAYILYQWTFQADQLISLEILWVEAVNFVIEHHARESKHMTCIAFMP